MNTTVETSPSISCHIIMTNIYISVTPSLIISDSAGSGNTNRDRTLTCNSGVSRPMPTLKWFKNGLVLHHGNNTEGYTISESTSLYSRDLYVVESVLTMQHSWYENGDVCICQASNNDSLDKVWKIAILSKPSAGKK